MKRTLRLCAAVVIFALAATPLHAQCFLTSSGDIRNSDGTPCPNTIISAVPFLRIVPDARSGAMGDVGLAISADPNAMHYNPSKLVFAEKDLGLSVTYTPWLQALGINDVYMAYASGYKQIDKLQTVGLGIRFFSLGEISFTDDNGEPVGQARPREFELNMAYARRLTPSFSAGIGLKYIFSDLATGQVVDGETVKPGQVIAADISFTYNKELEIGGSESKLTSALAITNIGPKITYTNSLYKDYIPANLGLGAALEMDLDDYNTFVFAFDVNKLLVPTPVPSKIEDENGTLVENPLFDPNGNDIPDFKEKSSFGALLSSFGDAPGGFSEEMRELMFSVGAEYWYDKQFAVRAGYYHEHAQKGNRQFFTVGMGLKYNIFGLNFSYLVPTSNQRNPLDNTLRFSLLFDFGAFEGDNDDL